jgi:hypothetical protein
METIKEVMCCIGLVASCLYGADLLLSVFRWIAHLFS